MNQYIKESIEELQIIREELVTIAAAMIAIAPKDFASGAVRNTLKTQIERRVLQVDGVIDHLKNAQENA
jgi:hypothetical protein